MMSFFDRIFGCARESAKNTKKKRRSGLQPTELEEFPKPEDPHKALTLYNLGCALQEQGKIQEAISCYREAIFYDSTHVDANYNLGSALQEFNALDDAEKFYKRAIVLRPNHYMAYYNLGYLYQDRGFMDKSIDCFRHAARIEPNDLDTYINLGLALKHQGQYVEAVDAYQHAIQIDSKSPMAQFNLGNTYQDMKDFSAAIICFKEVLTIEAGHIDALFNLAVAYQDRAVLSPPTRIDDLRAALECYEKVHTEKPEVQEAETAAAYLRTVLQDSPTKVNTRSDIQNSPKRRGEVFQH